MVLLGLVVLAVHGWFLWLLQSAYQRDNTEAFDYVQYWVPVFMASIAAEAVWKRFYSEEKKWIRATDSVNSISTGAIMQLTKKMLQVGVGLAPYAWVYRNWALTDKFEQPNTWTWLFMFFAVDFCYYWVHRTGHTFRLFWLVGHSIHHSSEEYNLTTALRQSSFHGLFSWAYYIPLAFFFPPVLFYYHAQFNLLYQFWIHTEAIPKLPYPIEFFFNTPSAHRVHHARNKWGIDTNYGGTLVLFDRLFGTYQEELDGVPICYGLTHSLNTMCPVGANTVPLKQLWEAFVAADGIKNKFLVFYYGPGWIVNTKDGEYPIPPCTRETTQKYDPQHSSSLNCYFVVQMVLYLVLHSIVMENGQHWSPTCFWLSSAYLLFQSYAMGKLMDRAAGAFFYEVVRILSGSVLALWLEHPAANLPYFLPGLVVVSLLSVVWLTFSYAELKQPLTDKEIGRDFDDALEAENEQLKKWPHHQHPVVKDKKEQ